MANILNLLLEHIFIVFSAVLLAIVIAIPTAIFVYKKGRFINPLLTILSILQSFPSLALFALLVPIIGIGFKIVIVVLFLYSLLPIFTNTIIGFKNINAEYYTFKNALQIDDKNFFYKVELPLAMPSIISGVRLSIIYAISTATIGSLVGAGGLGDLVYLGLQQLSIKITLSGVIPIVIFTIVANYLFTRLEKIAYPADFGRIK